MFFRNLTMFRFPASVAERLRMLASRTIDGAYLDDEMKGNAAKPCGPLELSSRGWVSPFGADAEAMFHQIGDCILITLGGEDKILPGAVVNDMLQKKVAEIEEREGRKLGGRARKALKEDLVHELLPRALVKPYRLTGYLDLVRGVLFVDTSSRKAAEDFVLHFRMALGSFPALPLNAELPPRAIMTGWIAGEPLPGDLALGEEAELRDPTDHGAVAKLQRHELSGDEVTHHLEAGKQCTKLGLSLGDRVEFVFGEDLVARKFKFLDGAIDTLESTEREDLRAELDARFALMAGEVGQLFDVLAAPFKFSTAEG